VVTFLLLISAAPAGRAQTEAECTPPGADPAERFGPTDISAVSGNRRLTVAVNPDATVTVLKWPTASFYDQIKYRTFDRSEPRFGALANEGAFLGLAWRRNEEQQWRFEWLRGWHSKQRFASPAADEVITRFEKPSAGITAVVHDVVAANVDAFVREIHITRTAASDARRVRLISFANFNPVYSKTPQAPFSDWCTEERNDDGGEFRRAADAIVHARAGVDESTGEESRVAVAMGFDGRSSAHHVGADTYETGASGASAYDDAADGRLSGGDATPGQADAAIASDIDLRTRRSGIRTAVIAAGRAPRAAVAALDVVRRQTAGAVRRAKISWWRRWLVGASLPRDAPMKVRGVALRSLITIRQNAAPSGLIVTSVATQPPYGVDWIRHGAYINRALHEAGHPEMVARHNRRYAELLATAFSKPRGGGATPPGNWAQNYYADGVVGGPVPYEIDATGFGIWTLWDHYRRTDNRNYLFDVYPAINRAAVHLLECQDPITNLQCPAPEEGSETPQQTLAGAQAAFLGLDSAVKAARAKGDAAALENAERWEARRNELRAAINARFFDDGCSCYTTDYQIGGTLLWPVSLVRDDAERAAAQAEVNYEPLAAMITGERDGGGYEARAILGNARVWRSGPARRKLTNALRWIARMATTDETHLLGEAWRAVDGRVFTLSAQPHAWSHALFYLAAVDTYGKTTIGR
jgi:GH15 family glucan-1,4-alpha-glucosidase